MRRHRHRLRLPCAALLALLAAYGSGAADARPTRICSSADLRYPFMTGGPKTFGVFKLTITGGTCPTGHRVAKAWMTKFEGNLRAGRVKLPRSVEGFRFTTLPATAAQTYRERGRKRSASIRFDYVV